MDVLLFPNCFMITHMVYYQPEKLTWPLVFSILLGLNFINMADLSLQTLRKSINTHMNQSSHLKSPSGSKPTVKQRYCYQAEHWKGLEITSWVCKCKVCTFLFRLSSVRQWYAFYCKTHSTMGEESRYLMDLPHSLTFPRIWYHFILELPLVFSLLSLPLYTHHSKVAWSLNVAISERNNPLSATS